MNTEQELTGYPSVDKPWLKYYSEEALAMKTPECTVYRNIYDSNKDYPEGIAIRYFGKDISYGTLFEKIEICAKSLKQIGIKEGECVTLCSAGVPEVICLVLACSKIGAIANFINPLFTTEQMIDRINDTQAEWIFILDEMYSYIEKALPKTCIKNVVIVPVYHSMSDLLKGLGIFKRKTKHILKMETPYRLMHWTDFEKISVSYKGQTEALYKKGMPVIMVYSSGTTGASKGIVLTNDGVNATIDFYVSLLLLPTSSFPYKHGFTFLQMVPVWFSTGIVLSVLMPLKMCFTVIPEPQFSKESFVNDLYKYKPTLTLTATSLWNYAIRSDKLKNVDLSGMLFPITGGEKLLVQDEEKINRFLCEHGCTSQILKGYGMCELGSTISASTDAVGYISKLGSAGYPILNVTVSAFDLSTNKELKYGERGEIRVLSPARMKGYYKNPTATNQFFKTDKDGNMWGCTGDIGYVDEDGEVFILGRATDSYELPDGERVYLFDTEEIINQDSYVAASKVVDIEVDGKKVLVAHIVLRDQASADVNSILERIHENCKATLPEYSVPKYYKIREAFPVHTNGKRDVEALRQERNGFVEM